LRAWFAQELESLALKTYPSAGNFLLANFGPSGPALFHKLEKQGILLRERSKDIGPGFVRITIGTQSEMQRLLKTIRNEWTAPPEVWSYERTHHAPTATIHRKTNETISA